MKGRRPMKDILLFLILGLSIDSSSLEETIMTLGGTMSRGLGVRDPISSLSRPGLGDDGGVVEAMASSSTSSTRRVGRKEEDRVKNKRPRVSSIYRGRNRSHCTHGAVKI